MALVVVLVVTGVALTWAYQPAPDGPELLRTAHRLASALLLPASWVLVLSLVGTRWGAGRGVARWAIPALLVLAVPAAAFTGFLLPWERVFHATAVVPPQMAGMGVAFDVAVSSVTFGGAPVGRSTFQRYVVAHFFLGGAVVALVGLVALIARTPMSGVRAGGRTRRVTARPRRGRTPAPPPRTRA